MNAWESTEMPTSGKYSPSSSIICLLLLSLRIKFSAFTVDCHPQSTLSTKLDNSTEFRRCPKKDRCATCFGRTLMIDAVGVFLLVVLATRSVRTSLNNLITQIVCQELPVLISLWWTVTIGLTIAMWWLFSLLPTTATAVVMKQLSWLLMSTWSTTCKLNATTEWLFLACNSTLPLDRVKSQIFRCAPPTTSSDMAIELVL